MRQVVVASPGSRPATASSPAGRVNALDITKGLLVVLMVIYHTINYSTQYFLAFRYMAFLPPTFIIITGFLLTSVYGARSNRDRTVFAKLLIRGGKVLLLFTALNIGAQFARSGNYHGQSLGLRYFFVHWPDTFLVGGSRAAAFEILLPIAYLLLLAPALIWLDRVHRTALPILAGIVVMTCIVLDRNGLSLPNLYLISAGLIGMLLGRLSWKSLEYLKNYLILPVLAYAIYATIVAIAGQSFALQLSGSVISLAAIYGLARWLECLRRPAAWLTRLGHYSLMAYILQIAILQILSHRFGRPEPFSLPFYFMLIGTLLLTSFSTEIIHWTRTKLRVVDSLYRAILP